MRFIFSVVALATLTACGQSAEPDLEAMAAVEGAYKPCAACHGAAGEGNEALGAPTLVNLDDWYARRQLEHFRAGVRGSHPDDAFGQTMAAQSAALGDALDIDAVLAQIDGFPAVLPVTTVRGDIDNGRDNYNMVCGACHGPEGAGNELLESPSLTGIDDWYLARQYGNFRDGIRGTHEADRYGAQMQRMGHVLETDRDIADVVAYLASLEIDD